MMRPAYNPRPVQMQAISGWGAAGGSACAGSGKGDAAGAAAVALGGFGFFGLNGFRTALGGGPAG